MLSIKMSGIDQTLCYVELAVDSFDATAAGGQFWKNSSSPNNEIIFSWPKFYWTEKTTNIVGIKIVSAEIPNVWDTINVGNNTLVYTSAGVDHTITVPVGNYTGANLATNLQTQISAITAGMTVVWNATNLSFTFTQTIDVNPWSISFPTKNSLYYILGFLAGSTNSAVGAGSSVVSTVIANLTGPYYVYLNSRTLGPLINFNLADGNALAIGGPQIARIPINVNKNSVIFYTDPNPNFFFDYFSQRGLEVFDLYLTLGSGQEQIPLDMKGVPWSVKFGILATRDASRDLTQKSTKRSSQLIS